MHDRLVVRRLRLPVARHGRCMSIVLSGSLRVVRQICRFGASAFQVAGSADYPFGSREFGLCPTGLPKVQKQFLEKRTDRLGLRCVKPERVQPEFKLVGLIDLDRD